MVDLMPEKKLSYNEGLINKKRLELQGRVEKNYRPVDSQISEMLLK